MTPVVSPVLASLDCYKKTIKDAFEIGYMVVVWLHRIKCVKGENERKK